MRPVRRETGRSVAHQRIRDRDARARAAHEDGEEDEERRRAGERDQPGLAACPAAGDGLSEGERHEPGPRDELREDDAPAEEPPEIRGVGPGRGDRDDERHGDGSPDEKDERTPGRRGQRPHGAQIAPDEPAQIRRKRGRSAHGVAPSFRILPQLSHRPVRPELRGHRGDAEDGADLLEGESLDVVEDHRLPPVDGEPAERLPDGVLRGERLGLRRDRDVGQLVLRELLVTAAPLLGAARHEEDVVRDRVDPRLRGAVRVVRLTRAVDVEERLLEEVVGAGGVAGERVQEGPHRA